MERVTLACVKPDVTLADAFDSIRSGTRGLLVLDHRGAYIVRADEMASTWNYIADSGGDPASRPIADVPAVGRRIETPPIRNPPHIPFDSISFDDLSRHFERSFSPRSPDLYSIQALGDDEANIVTSHEFLQLGQSVTICACVGNPVHRFSQKDLRIPGKCNKPHGVIVNCRTV